MLQFAKNLGQILACVIASIPVFWFMNTYVNIPTKLFSSITVTVLVFLITLTYVFNRKTALKFKIKIPSSRIVLLGIFASCLLIVYFVQNSYTGVTFSLDSLSIIDWLKVSAGILLGIFLPGYALISLFANKLNSILQSVLSVLLSIFINAVIAFVAVTIGQSPLLCMFIADAAIFVISLLSAVLSKSTMQSLKHLNSTTVTIDNTRLLIFLLCIFQVSICLSVFMLSGLTTPNGDMWYHASFATRIEKTDFLRFGYLTYPPFFAVHLFSLSALTGLPPLNIANILGMTSILILLAFYTLVLSVTRKRTVAFLSTLSWAFFGSFTFLIQALLGGIATDASKLSMNFLQTTNKTMQTNSLYPLANFYAYAPVSLTFLSVLAITALVLKKEKGRMLYIIEALLTANLFLLHVAETIYVLIFLVAALVLSISRIRDLLFITIGIWTGIAVLSTFPFIKSSVSLQIAILFTAVFSLALFLKKTRLIQKIQQKMENAHLTTPKGHIKEFFMIVTLSLYGLLLLIWNNIYIEKNQNISNVLFYHGATPTYFLPILFGMPLLISVLYLSRKMISKDFLDRDEVKVIAFIGLSFILAFLLGKGITYFSLMGTAIYRELRILQFFGGVLFSVITGYALYRGVQYFRGRRELKKYFFAFGLGFIILLGSGSTFLSTVFWANNGYGTYQLQSQEIEALDFLKQKVNASDVVLTCTQESKVKVGLTGATTIDRFSIPFTSVSSSVSKEFLQLASFIYLTKQEFNAIQKTDTYLKFMLPTLPVIFNNSAIVIFKVTQVESDADSFIPVVVVGDIKDALPKFTILNSLNMPFKVYNEWDHRFFSESNIIFLTDDLGNNSDKQKYLDRMQKGGTIIVLSDLEGYFSSLLDLQIKTKISFQELWASEEAFNNWHFDLRGGLNMGNISIDTSNQYQDRNSLRANATTSGTLGLYHPRNGSREFPFAVGGWFKLLDARSPIRQSLVLGNSLSAGVALWDGDYTLDYYYDGGKIVSNITKISPGAWQKIELFFPNSQTCYVYLNDTLVFVGPRSTKFDTQETTYMNENENTISTYFSGTFSALWNGLYYVSPETMKANGISSGTTHLPTEEFVISASKESNNSKVQSISWYTLDTEEISPFAFLEKIDLGKVIYVDTSFPMLIAPMMNEILTPFLANDSSTFQGDYENERLFPPIELYGSQKIYGKIMISSNALYINSERDITNTSTVDLEFENKTTLSLKIENLTLHSINRCNLSIQGSATVQPYQDEYVNILVSPGENITITSCQSNETLSYRINNNGTYPGVTLAKINTTVPLKITLASPNISVEGITNLEGAVFDIPFDNVIGTGMGGVSINGKFVYDIRLSDINSSRSYGSSVYVNGSYKYDYPSLLEIEMPSEVFASADWVIPGAIIVGGSSFLIALLFYVKNKEIKRKDENEY